MFPIRDHNPSQRRPLVTYALIGLNVLVFLSYVSLFGDARALNEFFYTWGLVPAWVGEVPGTMLTSMFLHGGFMHLAGNMLFLWVFGDNMEDRMGHVGFLAFYLAGGLGAAAIQILADPASTIPMVGASGAIAAVLGGYLLLFPKARVDVLFFFVVIIRVVPIPAAFVLGAWFGIQILGGLGAPSDEGGVAYWAHTGGFAAGLLLTLPVWLRLGGPAFWRRTQGHPAHPEAHYRWQRTGVPRVPRR
ncbi:rhomboid family intramembrane serine protease [Palleronia sp. KMU-117]|uniref:rhomboid family intramembrane serine protease n=1 Tax=Palleronia sp. KMU-117 TaxID=3434108 RepID=UPI003D721A40